MTEPTKMTYPAITRAWAVVNRRTGQLALHTADDDTTRMFTVLPDERDMGGFYFANEEPRPVVIVPRELFDALVAAAAGAGTPLSEITAALEQGNQHERGLAERLKGDV